MKVISFYSKKGGVGKSTHSLLFSSWLQYHEKKRVCLVDFELMASRLLPEREGDREQLRNPDSYLSRYYSKTGIQEQDWYPIVSFGTDSLQDSAEAVRGLVSRFRAFLEEHVMDYDYVVLDFHPVFMPWSLDLNILGSGCCDMIAVPLAIDSTSIMCGFETGMQLKYNEQNVACFWNNVSSSDIARVEFMKGLGELFVDNGLEILPYCIKSFKKATRGSDNMLFVKSTVCWPERYVEMACPELPKLYQEIKDRLDRI